MRIQNDKKQNKKHESDTWAIALWIGIFLGHEQWYDTIIGDMEAGTWHSTGASI